MGLKQLFSTLLLVLTIILHVVSHSSRASDDYYANIDLSSLSTNPLKIQLHTLINPHTVYSYDDVWQAFDDIDAFLPHYPCNPSNASYIPDVYSSYCWAPSQSVTPGGECGNYKKEGDCFNREHLWPKSWFGGFDAGANCQTDLFELWPSDGYVNGLRGDLPLGLIDTTQTIKYTSTNGCQIGVCHPSYKLSSSQQCFQPATEYQGDFARAYFYIATAYYQSWTCCDNIGTNLSDIKPWLESQLRTWHIEDPVNDLERNRNEEIYQKWQKNRNPFIDHPEWVDLVPDF